MSGHDDFIGKGFFSQTVTASIPHVRITCCDHFTFIEDTNRVLMGVLGSAIDNSAAQSSNWTKEAVAIRILMRAVNTLQGVIILAERGMVVQARASTRAIVEDSFYAAALTTQPDEVIRMFREGAEASRRAQGQFILAERLGHAELNRQGLQEAIDNIDRSLSFLKPKKVAEMGPLLNQYINYMRLSDNAAHTSATSLHHHVQAFDDGRWNYKMGPGDKGEVEATLHRSILAVMLIGVIVTQVIPDSDGNMALQALGNRFQSLAEGEPSKDSFLRPRRTR